MIFRNDFHDFDYYLENLEIKEETEDGRIRLPHAEKAAAAL